MRIMPRPWLGYVAVAAYLVVIVVIQGTSGIGYKNLGDTAANLWRSGVLSIAAASLVVAALCTWWGWWRPALTERPTTTRRWTIVAPLLLLVLGILNLAITDWHNVPANFIPAVIAVGVLVGFGEELTTRGLLLVALRSRHRERTVWIITCVAFGALHGANLFLGGGIWSLAQVVLAALSGSIFYIVRRVTGSLIWAMALHGFWDGSLFVIGVSGATNPATLLSLVAGIIATVMAYSTTKDVPAPTGSRRAIVNTCGCVRLLGGGVAAG
jgi:uncharacterized protein